MKGLWWEEGGAEWSWRRRLWEWEEEMLGECRGILSDIVLQPSVADHWLWRHDPGGGYAVRSAYL
ncbi:heat-shock protein, partial [Trifolium medium]|nr:heat-shock protein [Trifolium medium]